LVAGYATLRLNAARLEKSELYSTGEEARTPTASLPHGPEPCVSTNSTTPACSEKLTIKN